jgi:hypothetical protein
MTKKIVDLFNNCLENIFQGATVDEILEGQQAQSEELESLLNISIALKQKSIDIPIDPQFRNRVMMKLQTATESREVTQPHKNWFQLYYRRIALAMASVMVTILVGGGAFFASLHTVPGETLYPVKLAMEDLRLTVAFSDVDKTKYHVQFAERRANEMMKVATEGDDSQLTELTRQINNHLDDAGLLVEPQLMQKETATVFSTTELPRLTESMPDVEDESSSEVEMIVKESREKTLQTLQLYLSNAPEQLKPIVEQAIANMDGYYSETISIIETG